ncbi:MAG TPA: LacI family DNA-binding transcriptional regulator [Acidobacteriaceae bacterium]|nr:LacI family DNA-binding transcriptional regulator [Acidobacteriaceae bacterium]
MNQSSYGYNDAEAANVVTKDQERNPAGIKEIARALGISIGTVDRALHGRAGISPQTRAKVLRMADKLNYRPNIAARSLKLNRRLRIAVHLPHQITSFFDPLREGVRAAAQAMIGATLELDFRTYPYIGKGDVELLESDIARHYDGIILTPGDPGKFDPIIRSITAQGTPVVCVASDASRSGRLACVSVDAAISGSIAAELFARAVQKPGSVATITGDLSTQDHAEKLKGFAATLATIAPHLSLLPAIETHERAQDARRETLALLNRKPRPDAIYISTANSLPVLSALEQHNALDRTLVITTDLFPDLVRFLESGRILATLYQRPFVQGKTAFESLIRHIVDGVPPPPVTRLAPHIVLRSNLPLFLDRISASGKAQTSIA